MRVKPMARQTIFKLALLFGLVMAVSWPVEGTPATRSPLAEVTILCYMNGDNDLALEVLHALDMMETVGSSPDVNVVVLVDGHPRWLGPYPTAWSRARLLHLEADQQIGRISSPVIEEWGEADLGDPGTLSRFVRTALKRYPARRYFFYTFAHGQGIIDTRCYDLPSTIKTVSFSRDDTSRAKITVEAFRQALEQGLDGQRFELMVLFSCLANMVEVSHTLSGITHYVVSSQDEIRLVNQPAGRFQIRGLHFEDMIAELHVKPRMDVIALGRAMVDSHVNDYRKAVRLKDDRGADKVCRYAGDMALINVAGIPDLVQALDALARELIAQVHTPGVVPAVWQAVATAHTFASFLDMEYYDLQRFVHDLRDNTDLPTLQAACDRILAVIKGQILVYAQRSEGCPATGLSIYLSHPLVPDNIFHAHQHLYQANAFSQVTQWDEMIATLRPHLKATARDLRASSQP